MPASLVVDTDVVSFRFKGDSRATLYGAHLMNHLPVLSFQTLAELDLWALERSWGAARKAHMEQHLRRYVVYPYDRALCLKWAEVKRLTRRQGRPLQTTDAWIAAMALVLGVPLLTNNPADFTAVDGLNVLSEAGP